MKTIVASLLMLAPVLMPALRAESLLDQYTWQKRVVLILAPSVQDPRFAAQAAALLPNLTELADRKVEIITALPGDLARARFPLGEDAFAVLLIGLDGGIKLTRGDLMSAELIIQEIDGMPMRKSELRSQAKARDDGDAAAPLSAAEVIAQLQLSPEPTSGGYYREIYRSELRWTAPAGSDPRVFPGGRAGASTIDYLFAGPEARHRLQSHRSDEIYHFLAGDPIEVLLLPVAGAAQVITLGSDLKSGQTTQLVLPAGSAYTSRVKAGGSSGWSLIGATVVPGWQVEDVIRPDANALAARFPAYADWIKSAAESAIAE